MTPAARAISALILLTSLSYTATGNPLKPGSIAFGTSPTEAEELLRGQCNTITRKAIDPPQLPGTRTSHEQIDCAGYWLGGKHRLAEFVFRDERLVMIWVLIEEPEVAGADMMMRQLFGKPSHENAAFTAFAGDHTALRKDKPEFLFYAPEMASMFENWFGQNGGQ